MDGGSRTKPKFKEDKKNVYVNFLVPQVARHYTIKEEIGRGNYGNVYLAEKNAKFFAIKSLIATKGSKDVEHEIQQLVALQGKENIIKYIEFFQYLRNYAIVMDYFRTDDFKNTFRKFTPGDVQTYMFNLLVALKGVHSLNLTHGDIKPSNLLFNRRRRRYVLIDFGMTHPVGVPMRDMGTVGYIAPESVLRYEKSTAGIDIWSAGVIFLILLSGLYPFFLADGPEALKEFCVVFGTAEMRELASQLNKDGFFESSVYNFNTKQSLDLRKISQLFREYDTFSALNSTSECAACHQLEVLCVCSTPKVERRSLLNYDGDAFPDSAYDLLKQMLQLDPTKRISCFDALQHEFFAHSLKSSIPHCETVFRRFKNGIVKALESKRYKNFK